LSPFCLNDPQERQISLKTYQNILQCLYNTEKPFSLLEKQIISPSIEMLHYIESELNSITTMILCSEHFKEARVEEFYCNLLPIIRTVSDYKKEIILNLCKQKYVSSKV
jgi:hypothetical protein